MVSEGLLLLTDVKKSWGIINGTLFDTELIFISKAAAVVYSHTQ